MQCDVLSALSLYMYKYSEGKVLRKDQSLCASALSPQPGGWGMIAGKQPTALCVQFQPDLVGQY